MDKKLKILFLSSWYPNKYRPLLGIFVQRHAELLTKHCQVSVVNVCADDKAGTEINTINGVYTVVVYYPKSTVNIPLLSDVIKLYRYLSAWKKGLNIYLKEKGKPDIIQCNVIYPVALLAARLSKRWKVPYIIMEHWSGYFPATGRYKGWWLKFVTRYAVKRASVIAAVSAALKQKMLDVGLENKYYVIPNVVDTRSFIIPETPVQKGEVFDLIHVSDNDEARKNVSGIVRAFSKFHSRFPQSKLILVLVPGEGMDKLIQLGKSLGISDALCFNGILSKEEIVRLLQQSDAFVLFSDIETQSVLLLEAMCCGKPVISSRCGGPEEYITPKNGLLIDAANETQLEEAMETMLKNRHNYNAFEIRNSVADMVSEETVAKKFMEMYKEVLTR